MVAKVRFLVVPDTAAPKAALLSGRVDILYATTAADAPELKARPDLVVASDPTMELYSLLLQTSDPLLRDVRVGRAIAPSLDVNQTADALMPGTKGSRSVIPAPSAFYGPVAAAAPRSRAPVPLAHSASLQHSPKKKAAHEERPKSREETPKEGSDEARHALHRRTIRYGAVQGPARCLCRGLPS